MKQLIEDIIRSLVDKPEEVQIKEVIGDHAHVLELRVAKVAPNLNNKIKTQPERRAPFVGVQTLCYACLYIVHLA